jgi:hypothetical protein
LYENINAPGTVAINASGSPFISFSDPDASGVNQVVEIPAATKTEVVGAGWQQTRDLCDTFWDNPSHSREDWPEFMALVNLIHEPDSYLAGQMWKRVAGRDEERPDELEIGAGVGQRKTHIEVGQILFIYREHTREWTQAKVIRRYSAMAIEIRFGEDLMAGDTEVLDLGTMMARVRLQKDQQDAERKAAAMEAAHQQKEGAAQRRKEQEQREVEAKQRRQLWELQEAEKQRLAAEKRRLAQERRERERRERERCERERRERERRERERRERERRERERRDLERRENERREDERRENERRDRCERQKQNQRARRVSSRQHHRMPATPAYQQEHQLNYSNDYYRPLLDAYGNVISRLQATVRTCNRAVSNFVNPNAWRY